MNHQYFSTKEGEEGKKPNIDAVIRIKDAGETVTKAGVVDEVFKLFDFGKITLEEYDEANELLIK